MTKQFTAFINEEKCFDLDTKHSYMDYALSEKRHFLHNIIDTLRENHNIPLTTCSDLYFFMMIKIPTFFNDVLTKLLRDKFLQNNCFHILQYEN